MTKSNTPIVEILQKIKAGTFDAGTLHKETRQACVEVLMFEGYPQSSIASLLKTCDRTIRRDAADIRKRNSLHPSPDMTAMLVGDLMATSRSQYARFRQLARSKTSNPTEVLKAELFAWKVIKESFEKLNSIGFLKLIEDQKDAATLSAPPSKKVKSSLEAQYAAMTPMDREKLIEKLHRDILTMDEAESAEEGKDTTV